MKTSLCLLVMNKMGTALVVIAEVFAEYAGTEWMTKRSRVMPSSDDGSTEQA